MDGDGDLGGDGDGDGDGDGEGSGVAMVMGKAPVCKSHQLGSLGGHIYETINMNALLSVL